MNSEPPIVVEVTVTSPAERVWRAITDGAEMPLWFFQEIRAFRPERGFETTFDVRNEGKVYPHHWKVTEVVPNQRIVYDWLYTGFPGASFVSWELAPAAEGTRLTLTHTGSSTFPQSDPAFTRESCRGGWEYFLGRLKAHVEADSA